MNERQPFEPRRSIQRCEIDLHVQAQREILEIGARTDELVQPRMFDVLPVQLNQREMNALHQRSQPRLTRHCAQELTQAAPVLEHNRSEELSLSFPADLAVEA